MKKLIAFFLFASLTFAGFSQGLLRPVSQNMFMTRSIVVNKNNTFEVKDVLVVNPTSWIVRLDATMAFKEVNINKVTKELIVTDFSAIGAAIGIQHFVPTSVTDGTPYNNYGASLGLALGRTIYQPNLAEAKVVLGFNLFQYFKFGGTYTVNPPTNIQHLGYWIGGGITFGARFN